MIKKRVKGRMVKYFQELNADKLEKDIIRTLEYLPQKRKWEQKEILPNNRTRATKDIIQCLKDLGEEKKFYVCPGSLYDNNPNLKEGEWLFDMSWLKYSNNRDESVLETRLKWVELACECEWSDYDRSLAQDFEKLLVVKAKHRLFIFTRPSNNEAEKKFKEIKKRIKCFGGSTPNDRYLLACYVAKEKSFYFETV